MPVVRGGAQFNVEGVKKTDPRKRIRKQVGDTRELCEWGEPVIMTPS